MKIAFRVDASIEIGSGHVMRCLTLADELKKRGADTQFIMRTHPGHLADIACKRGHEVQVLKCMDVKYFPVRDDTAHAKWLGVSWVQDAEETLQVLGDDMVDWLIVDSYALDERWHKCLRSVARRILVIDDMNDRNMDCDLFLDQTNGRQKSDYSKCLSEDCRMLLGAKYALLRPEFSQFREAALKRREEFRGVRKILVSMGGSDPANVTGLVLDGLAEVEWSFLPQIEVILGNCSPHINEIRLKAKNNRLPIKVSINVSNMVERMLEADLAIGAGGSTSWERCCLGLPTIMITIAENQKEIVRQLELSGAVVNLGESQDLVPLDIKNEIDRFLKDPHAWIALSQNAAAICDGLGAPKVANIIMG